MAKFLNKKEQVIDFRLTPYGKYLISVGVFKPIYYSFFDDGVLYDGAYAGITESQNDIDARIKKNTQYLEGNVAFRELETSPPYSSNYKQSSGMRFMFDIAGANAKIFSRYAKDTTADVTGLLDYVGGADDYAGPQGGEPTTPESLYKYLHQEPRADAFKFESAIGDARFDGNKQQNAPAWKIITLQGMISSSAAENIDFLYEKSWGRNEQKIPQINIRANYVMRATQEDSQVQLDPTEASDLYNTGRIFADGSRIQLVQDNILIYAQEVNTEILNENFDIEVFEVEKQQGNFGNGIVHLKTDPSDGDTITIADGTGASNTYEFRNNGGLVAAGNVWVPYYPGDDRWQAMSNFKIVFNDFMKTKGGYYPTWLRAHYTDPPGDTSDSPSLPGVTVASVMALIADNNSYLNLSCTNHQYYSWSGGTATLQNKVEIKSGISGLNADKGKFSTSAPSTRINVSGITGSTNTIETLTRKHFGKNTAQIVDGYMVSPTKIAESVSNLGTSSVEYYFDIMVDKEVDRTAACRGAQVYDNNSYYLDLDFECEAAQNTCDDTGRTFYDIYGKVVEDPDICQ
jgi:hypothetical protein